MTQPEDDAARLIDSRLDEVFCLSLAITHEAGRGDLQPPTVREIAMMARELKTLRDHLSERDARERMVREQVKALMSIADAMTVHDEFDSGRKSGYKCALLVVLEIIDAKSDEQTPTTTGGTNES